MSSDIAIRVENLSKCYEVYDTPRDRLKQFVFPAITRAFGREAKNYYRDFWALKDVSFEVKRGETVGIVGRNGAGKSTLLQLICGTLAPSSGTVEAFGRISALLELGAGFNPEFTGLENVYLSGQILGLTTAEIDMKLDEILSFADIGEYVQLPVKTYSSGMFMRLAFSVATSVDPDILIVDEALGVGDAAFQMKCATRIRSIIEKKNATLLFVSHSEYSVRSLCEKALYLKNGKQVTFGPSGDTVALYNADITCMSDVADEANNEPGTGLQISKDLPVCEIKRFFSVAIESVKLLGSHREEMNEVWSGQYLQLEFKYKVTGKLNEPVTFVFNLYRKDGVYVMGTTTLMEGLEPFAPSDGGTVTVDFPNFNLLSGYYYWRVAVNDKSGLTILTEAKNVCEFRVKDNFSSVGVVNLDRSWRIESGAD